jgi:signal transduction histidine kinase
MSSSRVRPLGVVILLLAGLAAGAESVHLARSQPAYSLAGPATLAAVMELIAGLGLIAAATTILIRRPGNRAGPLLAAAGLAWLTVEWNNPGAGRAPVFAAGLALATLCPPLIGHAALAYPRTEVEGRAARIAIAFGYLAAATLGVAQALVFDPRAESCTQCPRNLLLVHRSHEWYVRLNQWGVYLGLGAACLLAVLCLWRAVTAGSALRWFAAPVLAPAAVYLGLVGWDDAHSLSRGFLGNDSLDHRLWYAQVVALVVLTLGVLADIVRGRRTRARLARLVVELAKAPPAGRLGDSLSELLGDPTLSLAYPLADGRIVDAFGRAAEVAADLTPIVRKGETVALLAHRLGLLDDPKLLAEIAAAARLSLENERLSAERLAQLEDLRASRARIVETGDRERQRLERDLHDGAQQRLVGLALALRMARSREPGEAGRLEAAEEELRLALADLRRIAHGIYPAVLADEGIAAALEELADQSPVPVILSVPDRRFPPAAEVAAYLAAVEAVRAAEGPVRLEVHEYDGALQLGIEGALGEVDLVNISDRVGALAGRVDAAGGRITVEIPCA